MSQNRQAALAVAAHATGPDDCRTLLDMLGLLDQPPTNRPVVAYVPPAKRPTAWARMATEHAARGLPLAQIAEQLCVTEETAAALLQQARRAAA